MARFPSLITTGGTANFRVQPYLPQPMNLMPAISMLKNMFPQKAKTATADDDDYKMSGTIGQVQQSDAQMNHYQNIKKALIDMHGAEVAVQLPEYKQAVRSMEVLQSPEYENTRKENLKILDQYKSYISSNKAGALYNTSQWLKSGVAKTNNDWATYQDYAQTGELGAMESGRDAWASDLDTAPPVWTMDDARAATREEFQGIGSSKEASEYFSDIIMDNFVGLSQTYNEYSSNYAKYSDNGTRPLLFDDEGKPYYLDPSAQGQLGQGYRQAMERAANIGSGLDITDKMVGGYLQGWMQRTSGYSHFKADEDGNMIKDGNREPFWDRYGDSKRTKEQNDKLNETHIGYFFKTGPNKGMMDMPMMLTEFQDFVVDDITKEFEKHKEDAHIQRLSAQQSSDEVYKGRAEKKKFDILTSSGMSYNESQAAAEAQGFTNDELETFISNDGKSFTTKDFIDAYGPFLGGMMDDMYRLGVGDNVTSPTGLSKRDVVSILTEGDTAPMIAKIGSDQKIRFELNPDWDEKKSTNLYWELVSRNKGDEELAEKQMARINQAMLNIKNNEPSHTYIGETRMTESTYHFTEPKVNAVFGNWWEDLFYTGKGDNRRPKDMGTVLQNVEAKVGDGWQHGGDIFNGFSLTEMGGGITLMTGAVSNNQGAMAMKDITIGRKSYVKGQFIPLSELASVAETQGKSASEHIDYIENELVKNGTITFGGNTFWNVGSDGFVYNHLDSENRFVGANPSKMQKTPGYNPTHFAIANAFTQNSDNVNTSPSVYTSIATGSKPLDKTIADYEKNKTTILVEAVAEDLRANPMYNEYVEKTRNRYSASDSPEAIADKLNLTGDNRNNFIKDYNNNVTRAQVEVGRDLIERKVVHGATSIYKKAQIVPIAAKYAAMEDKRDAYNWNVRTSLTPVPVVKNKKLIPEFVELTNGYVDKKNNYHMSLPVNVTSYLETGKPVDKGGSIYSTEHAHNFLIQNQRNRGNSFTNQQGTQEQIKSGGRQVGIKVNAQQTLR